MSPSTRQGLFLAFIQAEHSVVGGVRARVFTLCWRAAGRQKGRVRTGTAEVSQMRTPKEPGPARQLPGAAAAECGQRAGRGARGAGFALSQFWRPEIRGQRVGLVGSFWKLGGLICSGPLPWLLVMARIPRGSSLQSLPLSAQGRPLRVPLKTGVNLITSANSLFPRKASVYTSQ